MGREQPPAIGRSSGEASLMIVSLFSGTPSTDPADPPGRSRPCDETKRGEEGG